MKKTLLTSVVTLAIALTASSAEVTTVLSGVHNCCGTCEKAIMKATENIRDAKVTCCLIKNDTEAGLLER